MWKARVVKAEFLRDDLREIRALLPASTGPGTDAVLDLLAGALDHFEQDDEARHHLVHRHDLEAEALKRDIARKQASALATAWRTRTIRQEMLVHELRERIQMLQDRHHEQRDQADLLRRSVEQLRSQITQLNIVLEREAGFMRVVHQMLKTLRRSFPGGCRG